MASCQLLVPYRVSRYYPNSGESNRQQHEKRNGNLCSLVLLGDGRDLHKVLDVRCVYSLPGNCSHNPAISTVAAVMGTTIALPPQLLQ